MLFRSVLSLAGVASAMPIVLQDHADRVPRWWRRAQWRRAFAAKMLPPGQTASGFFYFQTGLQRGATLYLNGLSEAATGKEILYFELPLQ